MWYSERQIGRIGQNLAKRLEKVELRNSLPLLGLFAKYLKKTCKDLYKKIKVYETKAKGTLI